MYLKNICITFVLSLVIGITNIANAQISEKHVLPSWNDTKTKHAIVDFVTRTTTPGHKDFVPISERIAVFDNDGTLWSELPIYTEIQFSLDKFDELSDKNIAYKESDTYKALHSTSTPDQELKKAILEAMVLTHSNQTSTEFHNAAKQWLATTKHPRFNVTYDQLVYKPMVELLNYLQQHDFKTYIVSGGTSAFIRTFSQNAYAIPNEQVIGTMFEGKVNKTEDTMNIDYLPKIWHFNDKEGKPIAIEHLIGKKPIFAFGNSDGDLPMLEWTKTNTFPNLTLLLHHTDAKREYAYDSKSKIGKLDKGLDDGKKGIHILVDMKEEFKEIFDF